MPLLSTRIFSGGWYMTQRGTCYEDRIVEVYHDGWLVTAYHFSARADRFYRALRPMEPMPPRVVSELETVIGFQIEGARHAA